MCSLQNETNEGVMKGHKDDSGKLRKNTKQQVILLHSKKEFEEVDSNFDLTILEYAVASVI